MSKLISQFIGLNQMIKNIVILFLLSICVSANERQVMHDPIFGLAYDIDENKYEKVKYNKDYGLGQGDYWIYAQYQDKNNCYQIVAGLIPIFTDEKEPKLIGYESDYGGVYMKEGEIFKLIDIPDNFFVEYTENQKNVARGLALDAVNRAIDAYGGLLNFQEILNNNVSDLSYLPQIILDSYNTK
jgi:hypothetical protein